MSRQSRLEKFVKNGAPEKFRRASAAVKHVAGGLKRSWSADAMAEAKRVAKDPALGARLMQAAEEEDVAVVTVLLQNPMCDAAHEDERGSTALHRAARTGNMKVVELLMEQYAVDVNATDRTLATPFIEAEKAGHAEVAAYLKSHGALDSVKFIEKSGYEHQNHRTLSKRRTTSRGGRSLSSLRRPAREEEKDAFDNGMETGDVVDHSVLKKVALAAFMPFLALLLMQGSWFVFLFVVLSTLWFLCVVAFLVTELSIRPPWYHPHPGSTELSTVGLPEYWGGIVTNPKYDLELDYENVEFQSDSYTLRGWWVPNKESSACIVFIHGGGRDRRAWLRHVEMFHREGYNCLLFDLREHGASDGAGRGFSYGVQESRDVRQAAKWVRAERQMSRVAVVGTSVGGSSVILAAHGCEHIDVVLSENPITHASALQDHHLGVAVKTYLGSSSMITIFFHVFAKLAASILAFRIGLFSKEAITVIPELTQPIFLMHGTGDEVVPHHHSEELFAKATEPKELWMAPDAFHCGLYNRYPDEFCQRTASFLRRYLLVDGSGGGGVDGLARGNRKTGGKHITPPENHKQA